MEPPPEIDTALGLLLRLRHKYPQLTLGWDFKNDRAVAHPKSLLLAHPAVVEELSAARPRITAILQWEERHGCCVYVDQRTQEMLDWLYNRATEGFYPPTLQLYRWTSVVSTVGMFDSLRIEAGLGPAYPAWHRVLADLERLRQLEREGQL